MKGSKSQGVLKRNRPQVSKHSQGQAPQSNTLGTTQGKTIINPNNEVGENIPRNVNYYSHFLKHSHITGKDIEFVLKLRSDDDSLRQKLHRIPNAPFTVADKKITSQELNHENKNVQLKGTIGNVEHLLRRRLGPTPSLGQLEFETGLRSAQNSNSKFIDLEKGWNNIPKTQKKSEFPQFLPKLKEELTMRRTMKETGKKMKLTHTAFDGYQNYQPYDYKTQGCKNIGDMKHLHRSDAFMSTIQWQTNLR